MGFDKQLFVPHKLSYIKGENRPKVDCILCSACNKDPRVDNLIVWQNDLVAASINLYPYSSGHMLLFPVRHITEPKDLTREEVFSLHSLQVYALERLKELYTPGGFNIGYNVGHASGASIEHLHQHIVPRYPRELGFVDIIAGAKILIEEPTTTMEKLRKAFKNFKI